MPPNSQTALDQLKAFQGGRRKSTDVLRESETRLGVPQSTQRQQGLRTAITNTENLIKAVEPSVSGRTGGSLVTEAQKTRLVGQERAPLDTAFAEQSRAYEGESAMNQELQRRALQESQLQIAEDDRQEQALSGLYSTLYTREQDAQAKAERDRAFEEQKRANAASAAGLAGLFDNGSTTAATPGKKTSIDQDAYNEVRTRIDSGQSDDELRSDLAATWVSANNGNVRDKAKLNFYRTMRPQLFGGAPIRSDLLLSNKVRF